MDIDFLKQARDTALQFTDGDIQTYILKNSGKMQADFLHAVADQWIARRKARHKLPGWYANHDVIYPAPLSVEQSSSEITADYKAAIWPADTSATLIDLTGGMGVDTSAFARYHRHVIYIERNAALAAVAKHNFAVLGLDNIEVLNADASVYLQQMPQSERIRIYADPARRDAAQNKVFRIEDCEPDMLALRQELHQFMIKYSPMLDIKQAIGQLSPIGVVHVVAVENEVKELLFMNETGHQQTEIVCTNLLDDGARRLFRFNYEQEQTTQPQFADPMKYVFEPNAAILKAGAFRSIATAFRLCKLAPNSHLYTSDVLPADFPGRSFECLAVCRFDKKEVQLALQGNQANVSTRNFPMKPEEIKKKLGLKDGGDVYLFATESHRQQKIVLICKKVTSVK